MNKDPEIKRLEDLNAEYLKMINDFKAAAEQAQSVADETITLLAESLNHYDDMKAIAKHHNDVAIALADHAVYKNTKASAGRAAKSKHRRKTIESFRPAYNRVVQWYVENDHKKHVGQQKGREHVADLVQAKIGWRPSDSILYEMFPKKEIP